MINQFGILYMLNVNNIEEIQMTTNINIPSLSGKTFGIEVEFLSNLYQDDFVEALNDRVGIHGITIYDAYYSDTNATRWRIKTDGSLSGTREHRNGLELVSPIMRTEDDVKDFYHIMRAMDEIGVSVNRTCGLHVHIGMDEVTTDQIHIIMERYSAFESQIDQMMPRSRRDNNASYARSINSRDIRNIKRAKTKRAIASSMQRYKKCNTESLTKHNTLEFRHHSGTTSYEKIINWVHIVMMHVETSIALTGQQRPKNIRRNRPFHVARCFVESKGYDFVYKNRSWVLFDTNNQEVARFTLDELESTYILDRFIEERLTTAIDYKSDVFNLDVFLESTPNDRVVETQITDNGFTTGVDQNVKSYINERIADLASA
jgi:hypothetical protein